MKVAVYSGSFNPLHTGHKAIMQYLTEKGGFDKVYLVVSPQNPLKDAGQASTGRERYKAAEEAVGRYTLPDVKVDDIELDMEPPHYTIKTLDALKKREPENDFTLVIGADNLSGIHGWRDFPRILSEYGVAVYPRSGYDSARLKKELLEECRELPAPYVLDADYSGGTTPPGMRSLEETLGNMYRIQLLDAPVVDISSTQIRSALAAGKDVSHWLM